MRFELVKFPTGTCNWRLLKESGDLISESVMFPNYAEARASIDLVRKWATTCPIKVVSELSRLYINDVTAAEGDSGTKDFVFTVVLSPAAVQPVTVDYATADGTAKAGVDYVAANGTLSFAPGETKKSISVTVLADVEVEANETFYVNLSNPVNARLITPLI